MSEYTAQNDNGDQRTIKEINQKLTNEILNMQKLISHFDLKLLSSRLEKMSTLELYNEMMRSLEQNLAKVAIDRCHGDGTSIQCERIQIFNSFSEREIEITEMSMEDINPAGVPGDDAEYSNDSLYYGIIGSCYQNRTPTHHPELEILKKLCKKLETNCHKLSQEVKDLQQVVWKQANKIDLLAEEIVEKNDIMKELEENNVRIVNECKDMNTTLVRQCAQFSVQDDLIETIHQENVDLTNTQHVFTEQTGQIQNIIEELVNELRLHKSKLDETDSMKTILTRQVSKLDELTDKLQEENEQRTEQIDELGKKMETLENISETKWNKLYESTQNKIVAHQNLNKDLKEIVMKKNVVINMLKKEIKNENGTDGLIKKIEQGERKINLVMKRRKEIASRTEIQEDSN